MTIESPLTLVVDLKLLFYVIQGLHYQLGKMNQLVYYNVPVAS